MQPVTIRISIDLKEKLVQSADKRGLGYQTMMRQILMEHIAEYL